MSTETGQLQLQLHEAVVRSGVQVPFSNFTDPAITPLLEEACYEYDAIVNANFHTMCGCGGGAKSAARLEKVFKRRFDKMVLSRE